MSGFFDPGEFPLHIDFDELCYLAERDPRAYFRRREHLVEIFIASHPDQEVSLRRLQDRIDALRATAGSPQYALRGIMQLMKDHMLALESHMLQLQQDLQGMYSPPLKRRAEPEKFRPGPPPG